MPCFLANIRKVQIVRKMADILFYVSYDNRMFHYRNRYNSQALLIVFYDWECQKPGLFPDLQPQKTCECAGMTATASQRHHQVQKRPQMHLAPPLRLPPSAKTALNALGTTVTADPKCKNGSKCTWNHRYDCHQVQKRPQMHVAPRERKMAMSLKLRAPLLSCGILVIFVPDHWTKV